MIIKDSKKKNDTFASAIELHASDITQILWKL